MAAGHDRPGLIGGPRGLRAGFWQRLGASIIDGLLLTIAFIICVLIFKDAGIAVAFLVSAAYFTYFEGGPHGAGFGRAMRIRVVDFDTGAPVGYGRAFIRYIGSFISSLFIYLGYLWMLWDREKQCWHDKLASAIVGPSVG